VPSYAGAADRGHPGRARVGGASRVHARPSAATTGISQALPGTSQAFP